jgi:hypothetical protein
MGSQCDSKPPVADTGVAAAAIEAVTRTIETALKRR